MTQKSHKSIGYILPTYHNPNINSTYLLSVQASQLHTLPLGVVGSEELVGELEGEVIGSNGGMEGGSSFKSSSCNYASSQKSNSNGKSTLYRHNWGHGGTVVTHSPPNSEVCCFNHRPYVGKLVVGRQFTLQNLNQLYALVYPAH